MVLYFTNGSDVGKVLEQRRFNVGNYASLCICIIGISLINPSVSKTSFFILKKIYIDCSLSFSCVHYNNAMQLNLSQVIFYYFDSKILTYRIVAINYRAAALRNRN